MDGPIRQSNWLMTFVPGDLWCCFSKQFAQSLNCQALIEGGM
jgi:hypothetical protein